MNTWTLVLSIIGALAWVPIAATPIINAFRKIHAALFDGMVLTNSRAVPAGTQEEKSGTILLLCLNMFIRNVDYFPSNISAQITLASGTVSNAVLLDCSTIISNNEDGTRSRFRLPLEMEWNLLRTIHKNKDNIKCVAFLVENASFQYLQDIDVIRIFLNSGKPSRKTIEIRKQQFPRFNAPQILCRYGEVLK